MLLVIFSLWRDPTKKEFIFPRLWNICVAMSSFELLQLVQATVPGVFLGIPDKTDAIELLNLDIVEVRGLSFLK